MFVQRQTSGVDLGFNNAAFMLTAFEHREISDRNCFFFFLNIKRFLKRKKKKQTAIIHGSIK